MGGKKREKRGEGRNEERERHKGKGKIKEGKGSVGRKEGQRRGERGDSKRES